MGRRLYRSTGRIGSAASIALLAAACRHAPVEVEATALQVQAEVTPTEIAASAHPDGGRVQVVVSVTNPRRESVVVRLGGPPCTSGQIPAAETRGVGFGLRVLALDSAARARGVAGPSQWGCAQPAVTLGGRATVRDTFVVEVGSQPAHGLHVTPGTYRIIASFGRQEAVPVRLRVLP